MGIFLSTGELVRRLGIPPHKLNYMVAVGKIDDARQRVGGRRLWTEEEVRAIEETLKEERHGT